MKKILLITFFIMAIIIVNATEISYKIPQVLVIQSYHSGFLWSDNIDSAIKSTLKEYNSNVRIKTEYLDTKRFNSESFRNNLKMMLEYKYKDSNFDVIITSDNNAFDIVKDFHETVFKGAPVVFCGVNYFHPSQLGNMKNVTGVSEKIVSLENFQLIKKIHKNVEKIIVLNELTPTGEQNRINIKADIRDFKEDIEVEILEDISVGDLKERLRNLNQNTVVLYSIFFKDNQGQFLEYDESILMVTESANVPVYVSIDFSLGYGAVGGYLSSGTLQGRSAAKLAIEILEGAPAEKLPIIEVSPNTYYFDKKALDKWGIKLSQLPEDSVIINYEESYWSKNKVLIIRFSLIVLFLASIILWLIVTLMRKNKLKNELIISNESLINLTDNLEEIVQERTNELEDEKNFIRTVQDHEESLMIVFDKNGVISRANNYAITNLELVNIQHREQFLWDFFEEAGDLVLIKTYVDNEKSTKEDLRRQFNLITNSGKKIIVEGVVTSIRAKDRLYYLLTGMNVTEKQHLFEQLEKEENRYRSVYLNSGIALVTVAENGIVTMVNKKFEELSGYSKEEVVNKMDWQTFVDSSHVSRMANNRELRYQSKIDSTDNYETKLVNKKGYVLDVMLNVVLVPETKEIISSITDITAKNAVQNKMTILLEEQKAFTEAKLSFYKSFGQDLINPINSLYGIIDLIKHTEDSSTIDEYLDILRDLTGQLLFIVHEITNYQTDDQANDLVIQKAQLSEVVTYTSQVLINSLNVAKIFYHIDNKAKEIEFLAVDKLTKLLEILILKLAKEKALNPIIIDIYDEDDKFLKFTIQASDLSSESLGRYTEVKAEKREVLHKLENICDFRFSSVIINNLLDLLGGRIEFGDESQNCNKITFLIKKFTEFEVNDDLSVIDSENNIDKFILPNDVCEFTRNRIKNLYPLRTLIVNYNNICHFVLYKILEILNQKIEICTTEQDMKELIDKNTYDVIFIDLSVSSINDLQTLKAVREMKNISQPYIITNNYFIKDNYQNSDYMGVYDLINDELPDVLNIANIALLIEIANEYKNSKV